MANPTRHRDRPVIIPTRPGCSTNCGRIHRAETRRDFLNAEFGLKLELANSGKRGVSGPAERIRQCVFNVRSVSLRLRGEIHARPATAEGRSQPARPNWSIALRAGCDLIPPP